jgi:hypothetical protein
LINFESFSNVLSSLLIDLISCEVERGECLCEIRKGVCGGNNYLINSESFSNVLSSLLADLISTEIERSECLCEMRKRVYYEDNETMNMKQSNLNR